MSGCQPSQAADNHKRGDVIYQLDFDHDPPQIGDYAGMSLADGEGGTHGLRLERPAADGPGDVRWRQPLNAEDLRGYKLNFEARIRAEDVAKPARVFNGIKFMFQATGPLKSLYAQRDEVYGSFDWKTVSFAATVPLDATEAWLVLGLEATTGRASFDNIKVTVADVPHIRPAHPPTGPRYKGHDLPRLRGMMVSPNITDDALRVLGGQWNANHIRWQLHRIIQPGEVVSASDSESYERWLSEALAQLDEKLPVCREMGLTVLIDQHTLPGGNEGQVSRLFRDKRWQVQFVADWEKIARRYKGNTTVYGYDLANEPIEGAVPAGLMNWQELSAKTAAAIRAIDPDHTIVVEPSPGADPSGFTNFQPLDVPGIVYSVHMYVPHEFSHQGVGSYPRGPISYPGMAAGAYWDKERLRRALQPVIDFQHDYNVQIYVGEFSAIRWAPGDSGYNYLHDCIELFEEYGWDWDYHAFREYSGWSLEHGSDATDTTPVTVPTKRLGLLRSWLAQNKKPVWAGEK